MAVRHRHRAKSLEAVGALGAERGDAVVDQLRRLHRDIERHSVVALRRRWRDHLHVDAHGVEIGEPPIGARRRADVGLLLLVQRLGLGIGEMRQRDGRPIEIRLDEFRRFRHADMGVNVHGRALRPHFAAGLTMAACGGLFVFVPLLGQGCCSRKISVVTYIGGRHRCQ
jgi:hypothetical protein